MSSNKENLSNKAINDHKSGFLFLRTIFRRALQYWSDVTPLKFTPVAANGDFKILFASGNHNDDEAFDGPGGVLGLYVLLIITQK